MDSSTVLFCSLLFRHLSLQNVCLADESVVMCRLYLYKMCFVVVYSRKFPL